MVYLGGGALAMMADNIEHVITYWVIWQKFHSPALTGFEVISHWLPFLVLSPYFGALADRYDCRKLIQASQALFMAVSLSWGILFATGALTVWNAGAAHAGGLDLPVLAAVYLSPGLYHPARRARGVVNVAADAQEESLATAQAEQPTAADDPAVEAEQVLARPRYPRPLTAVLLACVVVLLFVAYLGQA